MEELPGTEVTENSVGEQINARSHGVIIEGSIGNNATRYSGGFKAYSGGKIVVSASIKPSNKTVKVGIVKPSGKISYVKGKGFLSHTFSVTKTGTYKMFISNTSGKKVTVDGSCTSFR